MDDLLLRVIDAPPGQVQSAVASSAYQLLCIQAQTLEERIEILNGRLGTASKAGASDVISLLLNTCVSAGSVSPDISEPLVERLSQFVLSASAEWEEPVKWAAALIHFFCTDEVTVSIFAEFDVPKVALEGLRRHAQSPFVAAACCVLLSHFNLYPIENGIALLVKCLDGLRANALVCKHGLRTLAEFTSFFNGSTDNYRAACREFCAADGEKAVEAVLRNHHTFEDIQTFGARIIANVTSADVDSYFLKSDHCFRLLVEAAQRFPDNAMLNSHILRAIGNIPRQLNDTQIIARILKHHDGSELVMEQGVRCLSSVAMQNKELKPQMHSNGCVALALDGMRRFSANGNIQEEGCTLLSYLSFDSELITTTITQLGGIQLVLQAMKHFPKNQALQIAACAALSGLTFNNAAGQKIVIECNGVASIVQAMRNGDKARLQENGCLAIGTMCWNTDLKAEVVRLGGISVIMKALSEHYASNGLVKNACRALAQIAFNCEKYRDEMSTQGVIPLIIRGMAYHPQHDRAQMHGCVALSYLSWTNESNASQIAEQDGYRVIVEAMRNHPSNHEVQEHACRALANISNVSQPNSALAAEQIVAAMRRHPQVAEVQEEACRAIVTLSLIAPSNKDKLYELNCSECVVAAMEHFPKVHLVQQEACNALAHLAYEHPNLNKAVTELGGVALLLASMKNHVNSAKVQLNACGGLSALAFDNTVAQKQIYEQGGVGSIIRAMKSFERLRMLELGCSVLGTLAWNTEIKEKVAVQAVPEILRAMKVYEDNPLLQKSTCRAVSQFAFNSESNRRLLTDSGAVPLIVRGMKNHITTEKLVVHALKALTYLCWENAVVAQAILEENVEEVLVRVQQHYKNDEKVFNEATHLIKILTRKSTTSPSVSKSPAIGRGVPASPPVASPVPCLSGELLTPMRSEDSQIPPPSPPQQDKDEVFSFYRAPVDVQRTSAQRAGGATASNTSGAFTTTNTRNSLQNQTTFDSAIVSSALSQESSNGPRRDNGGRQRDSTGAQGAGRGRYAQPQHERRDDRPQYQQQQQQQRVSVPPPASHRPPPPQMVAPIATTSPTTAKPVFLEDLESALVRPQPSSLLPVPKSKRGGSQQQQSQQQPLQSFQVSSGGMQSRQNVRPQEQQQQGGRGAAPPAPRSQASYSKTQSRGAHVDPHHSNQHQHSNAYNQQQVIPEGFEDPRFQRRDNNSNGGGRRRGEDMWDDPDPSTFHGNRSVGARNWQQEEHMKAHYDGLAQGAQDAPRRGGFNNGGGRGANQGYRRN